MTISAAPMMDELDLALSPHTIWFAPRCCVVIRGEQRDVLTGGVLLGTVGPRDVPLRNLLLVGLSQEPDVHLGELSRAFGLSSEAVRQLRRLYDSEGLTALLERKRGSHGPSKRPAVESRARKLFDAGRTVDEVHASLKKKVSRTTVVRIRVDWRRERQPSAAPLASGATEATSEPAATGDAAQSATTEADATESAALEVERLATKAPRSTETVQHLGTWLLIATVHALGLHARATAVAAERVSTTALRLAIDSVVAALALGEQCVEGVRRLATSTSGALLLATRAPSATFVRRTLSLVAEDTGGAALHLAMTRTYLERARREAEGEGPVFYVDNHLRPYTGKHVVRKGWRMQDKRVLPGASDYYVHDEDGRSVARLTAPHHGSLTDFLSPICGLLRLALPDENILVAFDRAGAFPEQMAALRDANMEFVTYERRPYALLTEAEFTNGLELEGEQLRWCEPRQKNLGGGRGRVRRICVLTEDGRQVNLVTSSRRPAPRLIEIMRGRWVQENGFKHDGERWGINQLDGRSVTPYPPDTIVPNPARRRLDRALKLLRVREGQARSELARVAPDSSRREQLTQELDDAVAEQQRLLAQRPSMPTHAPLSETELAGKLVHHELGYKMLLDTLRIACANAEAELAAALGPLLPRAEEAKKTLANLFAAPGSIDVGRAAMTITLSSAGTRSELMAMEAFLLGLDELRLTIPADQQARPLRFRLHQVS